MRTRRSLPSSGVFLLAVLMGCNAIVGTEPIRYVDDPTEETEKNGTSETETETEQDSTRTPAPATGDAGGGSDDWGNGQGTGTGISDAASYGG